jgi:hypothetical protein
MITTFNEKSPPWGAVQVEIDCHSTVSLRALGREARRKIEKEASHESKSSRIRTNKFREHPSTCSEFVIALEALRYKNLVFIRAGEPFPLVF